MKIKRLFLFFSLFALCQVPLIAQYEVQITLEYWAWQDNGDEMEARVYSPTEGGMVATLKYNGQVIDTTGYTCTWYQDEDHPETWELYRYGFRGARHGVTMGHGYNIKAVVTKDGDPSFCVEAIKWTFAPSEPERTIFYLNSKFENGQTAYGNTIYFWAWPSWEHWKGTAANDPPSGKYFTNEDLAALRSEPNLRPDANKFRRWRDQTGVIYYKNHQVFTMNENISPIISYYNPAADGASIAANLNGSSSSLVCAELLDPWSQDYADSAYGNSLRNRGLQAPFVPISGASNNLGFSTAH